MKSTIKESKTMSYSAHFKTSNNNNSISHSNIYDLRRQSFSEQRLNSINLNSKFAEETLSAIVIYFNSHSVFTAQFIESFEKEIEAAKLSGSEEKLDSLISDYSETCDLTTKFGLKNILDAFLNYNESISIQKNNSYEDIDFIVESSIENQNCDIAWANQTIVDPWYKN